MPRTSKRNFNQSFNQDFSQDSSQNFDLNFIRNISHNSKQNNVKNNMSNNAVVKPTKVNQSAKLYKVAIYARLSFDQKENVSGKGPKKESVETQIDIARSHMNLLINNGERMELHDVYTDLGKTGTNFNRDEFTRMMLDIRLGDINCIIVKDLSRFGRNYLEAGNYIEKIFPFLGVRFIAVSDGFDTGLKGNDNKRLVMNIKNLVNDMYAKDISRKAKIQLQQRREQGSYVGGPTPYGYTYVWIQNDNVKSKKLIIESETRPIVEMIFDLFMQKKSYDAVTRQLNLKRINPPAVYKKTREVFCPEGQEYKGWNKDGVKRILNSAIYVGTLAQGKTSIKGRNEANRIKLDQSEWIVAENSHEAIVSKEDFDKVQSIIEAIKQKAQDRNRYSDRIPIPENIFDDVLFCGSCGRKMTRYSSVMKYKNNDEKRLEYYQCLSAYTVQTGEKCESNRIRKENLLEILFSALRVEFAIFLERPKFYIEENEKTGRQKKNEYRDNIRKIDQKIERKETEEIDLYSSFRSGEIGQDKYVEIKLKNSSDKEGLLNRKRELTDCTKYLDEVVRRQNRTINNILKLNQSFEPTKDFVDSLVEKIYIYPGKRVEIIYSFANRNDFEAMLHREEL